MNKKILGRSLLHAFLAVVYVFLIGMLMRNGEKIFGNDSKLLGTMSFLLLFVISATVMGFLVLGKPILMYLENKKKEALWMFFGTLGWLVVFLILVVVGNIIF
ncbi:MAG: hypothetical protein WCT11_00110 [Candidatus Magasanikbacteria bacterium]